MVAVNFIGICCCFCSWMNLFSHWKCLSVVNNGLFAIGYIESLFVTQQDSILLCRVSFAHWIWVPFSFSVKICIEENSNKIKINMGKEKQKNGKFYEIDAFVSIDLAANRV